MEERTNRQVAEEFYAKVEDFIRTKMDGDPTRLADCRTFRAATMQTADEKLAAHAFDKFTCHCRGYGHDAELAPYIEVGIRWCKSVGVLTVHGWGRPAQNTRDTRSS